MGSSSSSSSSSSSAFPSYRWDSPLWGEIFMYVTFFVCLFVFNPTIEVLTFCLRGW